MESLHYLLMKSHSMMQKRIFSEAQKIGLTSGQPKVLDYLYEHEGSNQKTIAGYCEIEPATLVSILFHMEEKGLIERRQSKGNRRSLYVYLTEKGKKASQHMQSLFEEYDAVASSSLSETETEELKRLLTSVCDNLNRKSESDESER